MRFGTGCDEVDIEVKTCGRRDSDGIFMKRVDVRAKRRRTRVMGYLCGRERRYEGS